MTQVCDDAILQCYRELALTLRRALKSACHCFDARKPHFRKSTVCGDFPHQNSFLFFSVLSMVCRSAVLHCGYVLTHLSVWGIKDLCLYKFLLVLRDCHQQQLQILWNFCIFQPS